MSIFATEILDAIHGKQIFEKLFVNDVCLLDVFEAEIITSSQLYSEFKTIFAYMNFVAEGKSLPNTKFREIKGGNIKTKRNDMSLKVNIFVSMPLTNQMVKL